jgi:pyrroloquinoline quinone biosynthesis protein E
MNVPRPLSLVAELTYRCPLHCVYCSNPLAMGSPSDELTTDEWSETFQQAAGSGTIHLHLTGGEPLARHDLVDLVAAARGAGLYINMITSGVGLSEEKLSQLVKAGLDHIQLSLQDVEESEANRFAGTRAHAHKLNVAEFIRNSGIAFTVNVVVHRQNLDRLEAMIVLAESLGPQRIEIAHVQYYGWALQNRDHLLPTRKQVTDSITMLKNAEQRLRGRVHLQYVLPDYYAAYPKTCVGGWGRQLALINPKGQVLPCHAAAIIPGMHFDSIRQKPFAWIWENSEAMNRFRGIDWMKEPCRSCDRKELDFGGCRCQAFQLSGDATMADPVCHKSPQHDALVHLTDQTPDHSSAMVYRIQSVD